MTDIMGRTYDSEIEHMPIIRLIERHETPHGEWEEWAAGCLCGFYSRGMPGYYIPSAHQATRVYNSHLPSFSEEEEDDPETPEEALERWASAFMEVS